MIERPCCYYYDRKRKWQDDRRRLKPDGRCEIPLGGMVMRIRTTTLAQPIILRLPVVHPDDSDPRRHDECDRFEVPVEMLPMDDNCWYDKMDKCVAHPKQQPQAPCSLRAKYRNHPINRSLHICCLLSFFRYCSNKRGLTTALILHNRPKVILYMSWMGIKING